MGLNVDDTASLQDFSTSATAAMSFEESSLRRIARLQTLSRKGLWGITLFMAFSVTGYAAAGYQSSISPSVFELLGPSPPVSMISMALVVYCFSALVLALPRIVDGSNRYRGWSAVGYLAAFYGFFFYAGALDVNFWAVFSAGVLLLTLEYLSLLIYCRREIRQEKETIERHRRLKGL